MTAEIRTSWHDVRDLIRKRTQSRADPVQLAGGGSTDQYLDIKGALNTGARMNLAAHAMIDHTLSFDFNTVGGPTMGADVLSHAMALQSPWLGWFSVRDRPKDHGLGLRIEGTRLDERSRVLLIDDVASTGHSLHTAYCEVRETGARIAAVVPFVDRGNAAEKLFTHTPYHPLLTYKDLEIPPL